MAADYTELHFLTVKKARDLVKCAVFKRKQLFVFMVA